MIGGVPWCPSNPVLGHGRRLLAAALTVGSLLAQTGLGLSAPDLADPQPYRIEGWQVDEGLPQSSVTSIVQTHDGYLWLGTFDGLVRFDGVQFKVFNPNNTPGLPSRRIVAVYEDHQGTLWVVTEEGGLVRRVGGRFQACAPPIRATPATYIRSFAETGDGALWMYTLDGQLIRYADGRFTGSSTNWGLQGTTVNSLVADSQGRLWVGTEKEIATWREGAFAVAAQGKPVEELAIEVVAASRQGGCWVAANGRLRRHDGKGWVADYGAYPWSKGVPACMLEDRQGQLWVGTYGSGLFRYQTNGNVLHLSTKEGLPGDLVRSLIEDKEGNLWAGTEGYGLARLKLATFRSYGRRQGLSGDGILSVCEGDDGELWIGTNGDGVNRLKDGQVQHYGSLEGLTNEFVWSVHQDRYKNLWAGTWGGGLFKLERGKFVPFANTTDCSPIVCGIYEDSKDTLWLGQQRPKPEVTRLHDGRTSVLNLPSRLSNSDARVAIEDGAGNLWIGTHGDGLYRVTEGQCTRFAKQDGLSSEFIWSLYADGDGTLWIGTYGGGLDRLREGKFTAYTTRDGLVNDTIGYITEDNQGNLWCGSGGGVFRVSKEELNRFAGDVKRRIRCFGFTKGDGLPSLECRGGCQPSGCKTRDGRLWFPTVRGLAMVDPEHVPINPLPPPVVIEEVVLEGKDRSSIPLDVHSDPAAADGSSPARPLKIPPGSQRLEFRYTGLSLTAPLKVRFKYKLEGLEEDWVEAGTRRTANYSNVHPGDYRFRVLACNNDGVWNDTGASLAVIMLPRVWQTWWFRSLGAAALVLLFVGAYEIRLASERKLSRLRLRIARDLHDEVGSNLGSIALLSEVMPKQPAGLADEISEIRRIAVQTIGSLRDIVWFLDPAGDKMSDLVLRLRETAKTMLPGIPFTFDCTGQADSASASLEFRRNVFPMFKEILHNVAKHAHATQVKIVVEITPRQFRLQVTDNGIGFDHTRPGSGNGLKNLRRRAGDLGGALEIQSRAGHGAVVTLLAPITRIRG